MEAEIDKIGRILQEKDLIKVLQHELENKEIESKTVQETLRRASVERENAIKLETQLKEVEARCKIFEKKLQETDRTCELEVNSVKEELRKKEEELRKKEENMSNVVNQAQGEIQNREAELYRIDAEFQEYVRQSEDKSRRYEKTIQNLMNQCEEERTAKEEERKQKDDALTRLSAIAGDKLRNNNPGITDLSDPNRPMKIAEKFTEMYDNDWTDSMEALEDLGIVEEDCVKILLHFLTDSYEECGRLVANLDKYLEKAVIVSDCQDDKQQDEESNESNGDIPAELMKPLKDVRKKLTENNIAILQKKLPSHLKEQRDLTDEQMCSCKKFIEDCIRYAWMMQIQDPPVYIEWDFPRESKIDTNILRSYTKAGDLVDYIVWPVLYLHKDGPVLNKGVVQPFQSNK